MTRLTVLSRMLICCLGLCLAYGCGEDENPPTQEVATSPQGPADEAVAVFDKGCECKKLKKDGDKEGAEVCAKELKEMSQQIASKFETMTAEQRKAVAEAITHRKCGNASAPVPSSKN